MLGSAWQRTCPWQAEPFGLAQDTRRAAESLKGRVLTAPSVFTGAGL